LKASIDKFLRSALRECLAVKAGETVLVVTDDESAGLGEAFYRCARRCAGESLLAVMAPRSHNGQEPPPAIAAMMRGADIVLLVTARSLSHTEARRRASRAGARIASLPGATADMLRRTLAVDHRRLETLCGRVIPRLSGARSVRVTTALGTDLAFSLRGRTARPDHGIIHQGGGFTNLPAGEVYVAPLEGTAAGRLVIDGSVAGIGAVRRPLAVAIAEGRAVGVGKGTAARRLWQAMSRHGRPGCTVAEFGIGLNPRARVTGVVLEDEKALGTIHIAFGDNSGFGGRINVASHLDAVITSPTVTVDGRMLIDRGRLLV